MKIFLSCSFSTKIDPETGEVFPEFRRELESILATLRKAGHTVFAAAEDENWKIGDALPAENARWDISQIDQSDVLLAILEAKPSAGVQWEIGYANALKIPVYATILDDSKLAYWNQGLVELNLVKQIDHDTGAFNNLLEALDIETVTAPV